MTAYTTAASLTIETVTALQAEAGQAGDATTIRDCERTAFWLRSGAAAMGVRSRAAVRVARVIAEAEQIAEVR